MPTPLHPPTAACAPTVAELTDYDREHLIVYLRLLDADADDADWCEAARIVLNLNPDADPAGARKCWQTHLDRARWIRDSGYRHLLTCDPQA